LPWEGGLIPASRPSKSGEDAILFNPLRNESPPLHKRLGEILIERGKLGDTLIVEATCDKFIEHQPVERQCLRFERDALV